MKTSIFLTVFVALLILIPFITLAQIVGSSSSLNYLNITEPVPNDLTNDANLKDADNATQKILDELIAALQAKENDKSATADEDQSYNLLKQYAKTLENNAIVIVKHPGTGANQTTDKLLSITLHRESGKYSQYLLNIKHILFIFISGDNTLQQATVQITKQTGRFKEGLKDMLSLITSVTKSIAPKTDIKFRLVEVNQSIVPPCTISLSFTNAPKDFSIMVHEKNYWSFQAGVAASQLSQNSFSISSGELTVAPTAAQKTSWKSNLVGMIVFYPAGQDVDRLTSVFKRTPEHTAGYDYFGQRIGIFTGLKISSDPIQSIYTGINYAFSKDIYINIGGAFISEIKNGQTYNIGNISSVSGLDTYLNRSYNLKFFVGLSFSPSQMASYLK